MGQNRPYGSSKKIECRDLEGAIAEHERSGFRLDMISPADDPREARMSRDAESVTLRVENHPGLRPPLVLDAKDASSVLVGPKPRKEGSREEWIRGRAGMEYRDLIPDRLGGKVIASHIRLTEAGDVPDYVHYHKIDLQIIYCLEGRIEVVYEDQGEPFWLEAGDLVLQPSEIRHRVLECTAGAEVIEITSPAQHETWVEHELQLPNAAVDNDRLFRGRRFFRHRAGVSDHRDDFEDRLVNLAGQLHAASSDEERLSVVVTFSRTLSQS